MRSIALLAPLLLALPAHAQSADAQHFGARPAVQSASISPDGSRIAIVAPVEGSGSVVLVGPTDASSPLTPVLSSSGKPDRLTGCQWSTGTRLLCTVFIIQEHDGAMLGFSRMVALNADGSQLKQLSARATDTALGTAVFGGDVLDLLPDDAGSAVLMERNFVPETTTGHIIAQTREGLGVERVDTVTLKRTTIEPGKPTATEYLTDGHGAVRIMGARGVTGNGFETSSVTYSYRTPGSRDWQPLSSVTTDGQGNVIQGFVPEAIDRDLNAVYGFDREGDRRGLYRISLDGSLKRELVLKRDDVDISGLIQLGRQQRVIGATYTTEKSYAELFDPKLKALRASLAHAIPGLPQVDIVDASADETKLVLFAASDVDPGRYYLLDRTTKHMAEIMPERPQLAATQLATVQSIRYPAADGTMIPAYLTLPAGSDGKGLPAIVMPHGGPSSRDVWGFDWFAQFFAARGFAVLQPNYRGSIGYGEAWFQKNGFQSWRTAVGDINDGGHWLVSQGIAAPGKLAIVGWSYGGYAALQSSVLDPDLFKAIVAIAPVTDLETYREEHRDFTDYQLRDSFVGRGPHLTEGSPAQNAGRIRAPVLLFHGDKDLNVAIGESRLMASRLKGAGGKVELIEFNGLDHQLDDNQARTQMLDKSDGFLRAALGLPAKP